MSNKTRRRTMLYALASGLAVVFFVVSVGLWSTVRPLGDVLVAAVVVITISLAGVNGYWQGAPEVSLAITSLVAGGHVFGDYLRTANAVRLPPMQPKYYILVAGFAVVFGFGAYYLGWVVRRITHRTQRG